jgi:hypothetical protein
MHTPFKINGFIESGEFNSIFENVGLAIKFTVSSKLIFNTLDNEIRFLSSLPPICVS